MIGRLATLVVTVMVVACSQNPSNNESPRATIQLPSDPALGPRLYIDVQSWDGRRLFSNVVDAGGELALEVDDPAFLVAAVNPDNPNARRYAWVIDDPDAAGEEGVLRQALSQPVVLDEKSTARAFARVAARDLTTPDSAFDQQYGDAIETYAAYLGNEATCTAKGDADVAAVTAELSTSSPPPLEESVEAIIDSSDAFEIKLLKLQQLVSNNVRSLNQWQDASPAGLHGLLINRTLIAASTDQGLNTLTEDPISNDELDVVAATTLFTGWGNCRENAMTAASLAAQLPEVQQLAVVGLERAGELEQHAVAIACTEPKEVADLSRFDVFDLIVNSNNDSENIFEAGCHVIDPWLDEGPAPGNSEPLTADYVRTRSWYTVLALKMVVLEGREPPGPDGASGECNCAPQIPSGCDPFNPENPTAPEGDMGGAPNVEPFQPPPCDGPSVECPPRYSAEGVEMVLVDRTENCLETDGSVDSTMFSARCSYSAVGADAAEVSDASFNVIYEAGRINRGRGCIVDEDGNSVDEPTDAFPSAEYRSWVRYSALNADEDNPMRRAFARDLLAQIESLGQPCNLVDCPRSFDDQGTIRPFATNRDYARIPAVERHFDTLVSAASCIYEPNDFTIKMRWAQEPEEEVICPDQVSTGAEVDSTEVQAFVTFPSPINPDRVAIAQTMFDAIRERAKPCP